MCRDNLTASVVLRASAVNNRFRICKDVVKKQQVSVWNIYLLVIIRTRVEFKDRKKKSFQQQMGVHPLQPFINA